MSEAKILIGTTGTLVSYPRIGTSGQFDRRQPTSVTVRIGTPAVSMPSTASSGTVDNASGTILADAVEGADELSLTQSAPPTLVAGRRYILTGAELLDEVEVAFGGSVTVKLAEPLLEAVPALTSILGWQCSKALTTLQTAVDGRGDAIWTATYADGSTASWSQAFKIVRRLVSSTLTPTELLRAWPVIRTLRSRQDPTLEELITATWNHRVLPALADHEIDPEDIESVEALDPLVAVGCLLQIATGHPSVDPQMFTRIADRWDQLLQQTFARKDWLEAPQTIDPPTPPSAPATVRNGIGLRR